MEKSKQKQIRQIDQEITRLKNALANDEKYGDWKGIKYRDCIDSGRLAPYSVEQMKDYYDRRQEMRDQINQLETQKNTLLATL